MPAGQGASVLSVALGVAAAVTPPATRQIDNGLAGESEPSVLYNTSPTNLDSLPPCLLGQNHSRVCVNESSDIGVKEPVESGHGKQRGAKKRDRSF